MNTILLQLSDTHIREPGRLAYGRVDTAERLAEAVTAVRAMPQRPDATVVTGDLTDFGTEAEYRHLAALLAPLRMPVYLMPGNHDDAGCLRAVFPSHAYLGREGFVQYAVDVGPLRLVALDTSVPGQSEGRLCAERLQWLERTLSEARGRAVVIAMHHPPFSTGIGHMDRIGLLDGADALREIVSRHPGVERIVCGHLHRAIDRRFGGTIASTGPSPAHSVELDLAEDARPAWSLEPGGFRLHVWNDVDAALVTHLGHIGPFDGPHPFFDECGGLLD